MKNLWWLQWKFLEHQLRGIEWKMEWKTFLVRKGLTESEDQNLRE